MVATGSIAAATSKPLHTFIVDGVARQCESVASLLDEPELRHKFQDSFSLYFDRPWPGRSTVKRQLSTRQDMKNAFLLVNNIEESSGKQAGRVPDAGRESTLYNPQMASRNERALSLTCHRASTHTDFLSEFPCREINSLTVAQAGFYLCVAEKKLICHACGGSISRWDSQWQNKSLKEVHAKLFPACSFLKAKFGQPFIDQCQQSVAAGQEPAPRAPGERSNFYALRPDKEQTRKEQNARDYLALLHRLSHPVYKQDHRHGEREAYRLSSVDFMIQSSWQHLRDILTDPTVRQFFYQLPGHIRKENLGRLSMMLGLLQLHQDLLAMPTVLINEVVTQLAGLLSAGGKPRSPPKLIPRMKSMIIFVRSQKTMSTTGEVSPCQQLITLKTFFNESTLFKVLYNTPAGEQLPLMYQSFTTRCWLRQILCDLGCEFTTDLAHDVDDQSEVPLAETETVVQLTRACQRSISNQADFIDFLIGAVTCEIRFVPLLMDRDIRAVEGMASLQNPRTDRDHLNLEHFLAELVREHWDGIMQATTRQQPSQ